MPQSARRPQPLETGCFWTNDIASFQELEQGELFLITPINKSDLISEVRDSQNYYLSPSGNFDTVETFSFLFSSCSSISVLLILSGHVLYARERRSKGSRKVEIKRPLFIFFFFLFGRGFRFFELRNDAKGIEGKKKLRGSRGPRARPRRCGERKRGYSCATTRCTTGPIDSWRRAGVVEVVGVDFRREAPSGRCRLPAPRETAGADTRCAGSASRRGLRRRYLP